MPEPFRSGGQPAAIVIVALWLVFGWKAIIGEPIEGQWSASHRLFLLFAGFALLSLYVGATTHVPAYRGESPIVKSSKQLLQLALSGTVFLVMPVFVKSRAELLETLRFWLYGFLLVAVVAFVEVFSWFDLSATLSGFLQLLHSPWTLMSPEYRRLRLFAPEPSMAANYLLAVIPFFIWGGFTWLSKTKRILGSILGVILFLLTFSLGGYITLCLVVCMGAIWSSRMRTKLLALSGLGILLLVVLVIPATSDVLLRVSDSAGDESLRARAAEISASYNTFVSSPWIGVGLGNAMFYFDRDYPDWALMDPYVHYLLDASASGEQDLAINNLPVRILVEMGVFGFLLFAIWHLRLLRDIVWCVRHPFAPGDRLISFSILLASMGMVLDYVSTPGFHLRYLFFVLGLIPVWRRALESQWAETPPGRLPSGK